mgnify:CR=1 FL=1
MTLFQIVALYVALNLLLLPVLMLRVGQIRISQKISLGDGGDAALLARVRAHGNFIETVPFALIGLIALAMLSAHPIVLHIFGAVFTFGRVAHAHGMAQKGALGKGRSLGAALTLVTFLGMGFYLLYKVILG